jgi:hypothetical protein
MFFGALFAITASIGLVTPLRAAVGWAPQSDTTVPDVFKPFYEGGIPTDRAASIRAALPFDSVTLERRGGMIIPSGQFKLTLARNGEATLWSDPAKTFGGSGDFVGTVNIYDFGKLSHLISQASIEKMNRRYATHWTDAQTLTLSVTTRRETITIADYGGAGPVQLWSIEQSMMAIGHAISWRQVTH